MKKLYAAFAVLSALALSAHPPAVAKRRYLDQRLHNVSKLFIKGNSQASDKARDMLRQGQTCFILTTRPEDADAILEIQDSAIGTGSIVSPRENTVSGTLTLSSGDLIWSDSARFSDAPFMSGSKTAAKLLVQRLGRDVGCK